MRRTVAADPGSSPSARPAAGGTRTVAVWRETILPPSETFILNQLQSLTAWRPHLVGAVAHRDSTLAPSATVLCGTESGTARLRHRALQVTGRSGRLRQALRASGAEIVHAHFGTDAGLVLHDVHALGLPLVTTFHGQDATVVTRPLRHRILELRLDAVLRRSSVLVAVSQFVARELAARMTSAREVVVVPIGIPIPPRRQAVERSGILFVGRLVEKKGCRDLLEAVTRLPPHLRGTPVTVVGEGPERGSVERFARDAQLDVRLLGSRDPRLVEDLMWRSQVLCVPSRRAANGDAEGLGMVFLEAAACEAPVVSYAHGGVPEAVVDGSTGLLAPEGDVAGLARRLALVLERPDLGRRLGGQGRAHVERTFDIRRCTPRLEEIYDTAARSRTGCGP